MDFIINAGEEMAIRAKRKQRRIEALERENE